MLPDRPKRIPAAVWLGLSFAVLLDTPVQLLWKSLAAEQASLPGSPWQRLPMLFAQPKPWILLTLFAAQFLNWMWVLGESDLSYAQPFTALSYLTVSTGAAWLFHEHLSIGRIIGISIILCGVLLVGSTPHNTSDLS